MPVIDLFRFINFFIFKLLIIVIYLFSLSYILFINTIWLNSKALKIKRGLFKSEETNFFDKILCFLFISTVR